MRHNKLVRDRIPEIIRNNGSEPVTHIASNDEYWKKLKEKLQEEVNEFREDSNKKELADILEIIYTICDHKGISLESIEAIRKQKAEERGAFREKIILDETRD